MKKLFKIIFLFIGLNLFAIDATMEIIKKSSSLPNILISISDDIQDNQLVDKIKKVLKEDLIVSGHFNIKEIDIKTKFSKKPNMVSLKKENIDLYINLFLETTKKGISLGVNIYDINGEDLILNTKFSSKKAERYPFLAHRIAIGVNNHLEAPSIDWMDRFVIFSQYSGPREAQIVIADYTLTYKQVIIKDGFNIFPKWEDKNQDFFYYTTYNYRKPTLMKVNLYTGVKEKILSSDGMIICSDVSEDKSKILVTMSPHSQPDIYLYNTKKKIKQRITRYSGIDVSGAFVEDDKKIVFVSDRSKYPNIFVKEIGKRGIERLVYHGKNNSSCTTFEDYIVYTSREGNNEFSKNSFNLYLISTKSDFIRRLTITGRNQFPKFSADGDSLLFIKTYKGKSSLGIIRIHHNKSFLFPLKVGKLQSIDW